MPVGLAFDMFMSGTAYGASQMQNLFTPDGAEQAIQLAKDLNILTGGNLPNIIRFIGTQTADVLTKLRAEKLLKRSRERADELGGFRPEGPDLALLEPALQGALYEGREELAELWATLIGKIMNGRNREIRLSFLDTLKKFDPADAFLLQIYNSSQFKEAAKKPVPKEDIDWGAGAREQKVVSEMFETQGFPFDDLRISTDRLSTLGCLSTGPMDRIQLTPYGRRLFIAVTMPSSEES